VLKFQISVIGAKTLCTMTISIATFGMLGLVVMLGIIIFSSTMLSIKAFGIIVKLSVKISNKRNWCQDTQHIDNHYNDIWHTGLSCDAQHYDS
jgi:hypothetical protein